MGASESSTSLSMWSGITSSLGSALTGQSRREAIAQTVTGSRSSSDYLEVSDWMDASFINLMTCFSAAYLSYSSARRLLDP